MLKFILSLLIVFYCDIANGQYKSKRLLHFFDECIINFESGKLDSVFIKCNEFERKNQLSNNEIYYLNAMRGYLYFELGKNKRALSQYKKSIHLINDKNPDKNKLIAHASSIIAGNYFSMQKYDSAFFYASETLKSEVKDGIIAEMLQIMGYCEFKNNNFIKAEKHLLKAKEIHLKMNGEDDFMLANCYSKLIELYSAQNNYELVEFYAKEGELIAFSSDNKNSLMLFWKSLEKVSLSKNDIRKAYFYRDKVDSIVEIINLKENNEQINKLNIKYQSELKTTENKRLKALNYFKDSKIENQQLLFYGSIFVILFSLLFILILIRLNKKRQVLFNELEIKNHQIENQNSELERQHHLNQRIFGVISHDFKEPLLLIGLNLKQYNQNYSKENLIKLESQISNSNMILNNLLKWAKIELNYSDKTNKKTLVKELVNEIIVEFETVLNEKKLKVNSLITTDLILNIPKEVLRISIRNLMSNAIKYSLKNNHINIGSSNTNSIYVEDFGIGITESLRLKLFKENVESLIGTGGEHGFGIGLQFTKEILEKYNFQLYIDQSIKKSTCFVIQAN